MDMRDEVQEQTPNDLSGQASGGLSVWMQTVIVWLVVALVVSIVMCVFNRSMIVIRASFFEKFFAVIVGWLLGWIGALIGDALRRFARPDQVYTSGGFFHLIGLKLFWLCGPQLIGLVLGCALGLAWVLR